MIKRLSPHIFLIFILFFIGFLVFKDFFNFSLWGDDWMLSFYILEHRVAGTIPRLYFSLYGGQAMLMDAMNHLFRFEPSFYFYTSYLLRFIASVAIYFLTFYISKKKLIAFFASLFFLTSFTGIESTNWVHNSVNYFALAVFLFGFLYWLKHQKENKRKIFSRNMFVCFGLFTLAIIVAAVRMHGLLPFFIFAETYLIVTKETKLIVSTLRILILLFIFWILVKLGLFGAAGSFTSGMLKAGLLPFIKQSNVNLYKFLLFPFGSFANMIFPTPLFSSSSFYQEFLVNISFGINELIFFTLPFLLINIVLTIRYKKICRILKSLKNNSQFIPTQKNNKLLPIFYTIL